MTETLRVNETEEYEVIWFDGKNGTGNIVTPTVQSTWSSSNAAALGVAPTDLTGVNVTGIGLETGATIDATDPTSGVSAQPLAFDVVAGAIQSGVIQKKAAAPAA